MSALWVDSEPRGEGHWVTVLSGVLDSGGYERLVDEARALALAGARSIDISLAGVRYLDTRGADVLDEVVLRLGHLDIPVRIGGAIGQPAELLSSRQLLPGSPLSG